MRELNCILCSIRAFMCYHYLNLKEQMQILGTLSFVELKGNNSYLLINSFLKYVCNARPLLLPNVGHDPICKELLNFIIKVILSFHLQSSNWATASSGSPTRESDHTNTELATTSTRQSEWNNHTLQCQHHWNGDGEAVVILRCEHFSQSFSIASILHIYLHCCSSNSRLGTLFSSCCCTNTWRW